MLHHFIDFADSLRIRQHLRRVENLLRERDVQSLPPALRRTRTDHLDHLREYWQRGIFPHNTSHFHPTPCFIDQGGRSCAVAHLLIASGEIEAARQIAEVANFAYIKEMDFPEVDQWAAKSGLSKDELALIQPSYCPQGAQNEFGVAIWFSVLAVGLIVLGVLPVLWSWIRLILRKPLGRRIALFDLRIGVTLCLVSLIMVVLLLTGKDLMFHFYSSTFASGGFSCIQTISRLSYEGVLVVLLIGTLYAVPEFIRRWRADPTEEFAPTNNSMSGR